jgi:hypothetical protein
MSFFQKVPKEYQFMRRPVVLTVLTLFSALTQLPARAQEKTGLPKAETVIEQYIEATGGKALYEKFKNWTQTGTIEVPAQNITGKVQYFQAAPNLLAVIVEIAAVGKTIEGTDGKDAWQVNPIAGERLLEGDEKEDFIRDARFNDDLYAKELWDKIECVGVEDVEGKPAYKLVFTAKTKKTVTKFYDKTSHLHSRALPWRLQTRRRAPRALQLNPEGARFGVHHQDDGDQARRRHPR